MAQNNSYASQDPMTKKSRELYIGNLPEGVPEGQLMSFLNAALLQAGLNLQPGMPITGIRCNGRFAFAEFRSSEETTNAMNMNGIVLVGQALNVGRPSAYTGPPTQNVRWEQLMAKRIQDHPELKDTAIGLAGPGGANVHGGGGGSDPATKICRELYIGNMPENTPPEHLTSFFNQEMAKKQYVDGQGPCCLQARINGRFAFVEFRSIPETDRALTLNGCMFQGCSLRVGRPKAYQGPPGSTEQSNAMAISSAALNMQGTGGKATQCIQMGNMLTVDELRVEEDYQEIFDDVKGELDKYGTIEKMVIPKPPAEGDVPDCVSLVYVKYEQVKDAIAAQVALEGRTFADNSVSCCFYPEDKFEAEEWVDIIKLTAPKPEPVAPVHQDALPANIFGGPAPPQPGAPMALTN